ncbi:MAG: SMP-30/gluconolactonase/LRE family protein [Magnetospirillum sp.]|nr:SMP-30/gluconolactonase/LRE family protein [Magnetospirillum sp.]
MKRLLAVLLLAAVPAAAAEPLWEASGFANPESVLWDPAKKVLYVSNVNGGPPDKDGNGYISKLSPEGKLLAGKWAVGLDGPKGMAVFKGRLYVSDIDRLVEIDSNTGKITRAYPAAGARFLNDVTVDDKGAVYVSDMLTNTIWRLSGGKFESWLVDPQLQNPNGLKAESTRLVVASWGPMTGEGFATKSPGNLKAVTFADKMIRDLTQPFGNLDGLESDGKGGWLVSDWVAGKLFQVDRRGRPTKLMDFPQGSADIGIIPDKGIVLVPLMMDGKVQAFRMP